MQRRIAVAALPLFVMPWGFAQAQDLSSEVAQIRQLLVQMQSDYETRIADLEARLAAAESMARQARGSADEAMEVAEETAIASAGQSSANALNPSIGAVLIGRYTDVDQGWETIPGFSAGGELGPGGTGVSLGETEINLKANVDSRYFGNLTLALEDEDGQTEVAVEEAWVETTGLASGLTVRGGRYFSGSGYLNGFHRHADDFADRPLPYQAFFGGQYIPDGVQARWIAPTSIFLEVGAELNWGSSFPTTGNGENSPDATAVFVKTGGDIGASQSWQAGLTWLTADITERPINPEDDDRGFAITGDSDLGIIDFVWKWAPGGNAAQKNLKVQGEYFYRDEDGLIDGRAFGDPRAYEGEQDGWYLQSVWQFMRNWRLGYRHDRVGTNNTGDLEAFDLDDPMSDPRRDTLMIDWSPSEFARLRLQFTHDNVLEESDNQWALQYLMSIGAHGAHQF